MVEEEPKSQSSAKRIKIIRKATGLNQTEFGRNIGVTQANLSNYEKGKTEPGIRIIHHLLKTYRISLQWWESGLGEMFQKTESSALKPLLDGRRQLPLSQLTNEDLDKYVPYYTINITDSGLEDYFDANAAPPAGYLYAPQFQGCIMVNMYGDAMSDHIQSGDRLYVHRLNPNQTIDFGQIYLVVLEEFRLLKYIQQHPTDKTRLVLTSPNKRYMDWDISKNDIQSLFLIKGVEKQHL